MDIRKKTTLNLFVFLAVTLLLATSGRTTSGGEEALYRVTRNLIERGDLALTSEALTLQARSEPGFLPQNRPIVSLII